MRDYGYVKEFSKLGFGLFVHFGLYSIVGKGEWFLHASGYADVPGYEALAGKFRVSENWARDLVSAAKKAGAKYITLTTRHHDGFSLYDARGLSDFDAPHSACGRDLVAEFVSACRESGIVPFFYHTLLDWHNKDYENDFPAYIDYLVKSVEILCRNYGKIGGFWFDGMWNKMGADWQEDRLYGTIRKYQPTAMIINNTGLSAGGKTGHPEIDSVTFERSDPSQVKGNSRPRAGEMCQVLNDHWGYAENDCNYKSVGELICNLVDSRSNNCNFLLNTGPMGDGKLNPMDENILLNIGKWVRANGFIYDSVRADGITAENASVLFDGKYYYALIKNVPMSLNENISICGENRTVTVSAPIRSAIWLDSGESVELKTENSFAVQPFYYGASYNVRVVRFTL